MTVTLLDFGGRRSTPVILQTEAAECGLACLAMIASFHGHRIDLNTLRRQYPISLKGVTLRGLMQTASHLHLATRPLRFELTVLRHLSLPAILHWDLSHFVVLTEVRSRSIVIHDPASGVKVLPLSEASKHITGVALELTPTQQFSQKNETNRLKFSAFVGKSRGLGRALAEVFILSLVLEALVIAAPFYMQLTVDEVIARGDVDLLLVLLLGFALLAVIRIFSAAVRARIILVLQNSLGFQIAARLFRHLIRLPLTYFEKRRVGDVLSRFGSIEPIRNILAEGLIAAVIDGLMAIITLVMIFFYSVKLALVVLCAFLLYAGLRFLLFRPFVLLSEAAIECAAKEDSHFIETVRAVQSLKLFNREIERENQWLNRYADFVNANMKLGRAKIGFSTINGVVFAAENLITVYLAAHLVLDGALTVGMVFAFMSYKSNFIDKASMLIETALEVSVLKLHLIRLSDIAMTDQEKGHDRPLSYSREVVGGITLRNVSFRYSETEPFVLKDINLDVEPGRFLTIMGPSGGGKSTLMKIMLGLLEPTSGDVLIDGVPLSVVGVRNYRENVAAVMQDDHLLSGSIADNICFFDQISDHERMIESAQAAGIHDEIMAMPMTYNSLIGDMGSSLSGGQKQRVLLARALYRQPKILFLDEGTSHLDVENERLVNESLRRLKMTRISIAHRPEITSGADTILRIEQSCMRLVA
jgi:ATP-binding cassette subfamily B protein RaxB